MTVAINVLGWLIALAVAYLPGLEFDRIGALAAVVTTVCVLNLWARRR